jgi:predicted nuclease of predicted toxin-antitoxin system
VKLWIDEDLSPSLVGVANAAGYEATCVRDRGRLRSADHVLAEIVLDEGWVLVTNNAGDFLKLVQDQGLHPGLVFLELGSAAEEGKSLDAAIEHIKSLAEAAGEAPAEVMINHVVEVDGDRHSSDYTWP